MPVQDFIHFPLQVGAVHHEMMHALGFRHEQSRSDRDEYITVKTENIRESSLKNFDKRPTLNKTPYDLGSILQYSMKVSVSLAYKLNKMSFGYCLSKFEMDKTK